MRMSLAFRAALALAGIGGCSVQIPDGAYACRVDRDCPPAFSCFEQRCHRAAPDAGAAQADAQPLPPDDGLDAGQCSTGDCDGGLAADGGCDGGECDASAAVEQCNGADDDGDGLIDDGLVTLRPVATLPALGVPVRTRIFPAPDGSVLVLDAELDDSGQLTLYATRLAPDGSPLGERSTLANAGNYLFEAAVDGDTLALVRATDDQGILVSAFDARTLAPLLADLPINESGQTAAVYDVAVTRDALGPHLYAVYYEGEVITLASVSVVGGDVSNVERTALVDTAVEGVYPYLQLSAAPCSRGLYLSLRRLAPDPVARILGVNATGALTGLDLPIPLPASEGVVLSDARTVLAGGTCQRTPSHLYAAFGRFLADDRAALDPGDVREPGSAFFDVLRVDLARATAEGTSATPTWRVRVDSPRPSFPQDLRSPPSRALAIALRGTDELWLAGTTIEPDSRTGDITAFALSADGSTHEFAGGSVAPSIPSHLEMAAGPGGQLWLAGSWWGENAPTQVFTLGCE
jgi:hypothetical protein